MYDMSAYNINNERRKMVFDEMKSHSSMYYPFVIRSKTELADALADAKERVLSNLKNAYTRRRRNLNFLEKNLTFTLEKNEIGNIVWINDYFNYMFEIGSHYENETVYLIEWDGEQLTDDDARLDITMPSLYRIEEKDISVPACYITLSDDLAQPISKLVDITIKGFTAVNIIDEAYAASDSEEHYIETHKLLVDKPYRNDKYVIDMCCENKYRTENGSEPTINYASETNFDDGPFLRQYHASFQRNVKKIQKCKDCGKYFAITNKQAEYFENIGFDLPKRCYHCRKARKRNDS